MKFILGYIFVKDPMLIPSLIALGAMIWWGLTPVKHEIRDCSYSILTNQEACKVTEVFYTDGWLLSAFK
jgi:hypothetical protein